jgi:hypothetical protein
MPAMHGDNDQRVQDLLSKAARQQCEPMPWHMSVRVGCWRVLPQLRPSHRATISKCKIPSGRSTEPHASDFCHHPCKPAVPDALLCFYTSKTPSATTPSCLSQQRCRTAQTASHGFLRTPSTGMRDHRPSVQAPTGGWSSQCTRGQTSIIARVLRASTQTLSTLFCRLAFWIRRHIRPLTRRRARCRAYATLALSHRHHLCSLRQSMACRPLPPTLLPRSRPTSTPQSRSSPPLSHPTSPQLAPHRHRAAPPPARCTGDGC